MHPNNQVKCVFLPTIYMQRLFYEVYHFHPLLANFSSLLTLVIVTWLKTKQGPSHENITPYKLGSETPQGTFFNVRYV